MVPAPWSACSPPGPAHLVGEVGRVELALAAERHHDPPHHLALVEGQAGRVAVHVAVDGVHAVGLLQGRARRGGTQYGKKGLGRGRRGREAERGKRRASQAGPVPGSRGHVVAQGAGGSTLPRIRAHCHSQPRAAFPPHRKVQHFAHVQVPWAATAAAVSTAPHVDASLRPRVLARVRAVLVAVGGGRSGAVPGVAAALTGRRGRVKGEEGKGEQRREPGYII